MSDINYLSEYEKIYNFEEMIKNIKLSTETDKSDELIKYKIITAHKNIMNYLNYDEIDMVGYDGKAKFAVEVTQYCEMLIDYTETNGLTQKTQGERSETYQSTSNIPEYIIKTLPLPRIRLF